MTRLLQNYPFHQWLYYSVLLYHYCYHCYHSIVHKLYLLLWGSMHAQ